MRTISALPQRARALASLAVIATLAIAASPPGIRAQASLDGRVDGLVRAARKVDDMSAKEAAVLLVALTHCHRGYDKSDGPIVREPLRVLFAQRRADGLIGQGSLSEDEVRDTTAWAHMALASLDAKGHAADLAAIEKSFAGRFHLTGNALAAALQPFGAAKAEGIAGVREPFAELIQAVASQQAEKQQDAKPARAAKTWAPFMQKALDWLLAQQSSPGIWSMPTPDGKTRPETGLTSLALAALGGKPAASRSEAETKALTTGVRYLLDEQKKRENGAFADNVPNYVTCAAVLALSRARDIDIEASEIAEALAKAQKYLLTIQNIERNGYSPSDRDYGSIGYGGDERGDLSNTQMAVEALRATGLDASNDAFAKALVYLRRVQNLPGQGSWSGQGSNEKGEKIEVVAGDDGGAQYYPGVSYAGYDETASGGFVPRSYGSMTYALLKCYVLAGLDRKDERLEKALQWCFRNFTVDVNPGAKASLGEKVRYQGLFYYYVTLARALSLAGVKEIPAREEGAAPIDWKQVLAKKLEQLQLPDGSWVNAKNGRWWEASPLLCTAYALLALSED